MTRQLWPQLWDLSHGPCWIHETKDALESLDEWRKKVITTGVLADGLVKVMCREQQIFNGFGRHTTNDLLHILGLWPGTPPYVVCSDDVAYSQFRTALLEYTQTWTTDQYWKDCLAPTNLHSPVAFNHRSDSNYMNRYMFVFRKSEISQMPGDLYNTYVRKGLLNPDHMIGTCISYIWTAEFVR